jgi:hypothetical protein
MLKISTDYPRKSSPLTFVIPSSSPNMDLAMSRLLEVTPFAYGSAESSSAFETGFRLAVNIREVEETSFALC